MFSRNMTDAGVSYIVADELKSASLRDDKLHVYYSTSIYKNKVGYFGDYLDSTPYKKDTREFSASFDLGKLKCQKPISGEKNRMLLSFLEHKNISTANIIKPEPLSKISVDISPPGNEPTDKQAKPVNLYIYDESHTIKKVDYSLRSAIDNNSPYSLYYIKHSHCPTCYDLYLVNVSSEVSVVELPHIPEYKDISPFSAFSLFLYPLTLALDLATSPVQIILAWNEVSDIH